jgi:hypothetical protein
MFWRRNLGPGSRVRLIEFRENAAEVFIEAEPRVVWEHMSDVKNYNRWSKMYRIVDSVDKLDKLGDWYDYELTILGVPIKGRMVSCYRVPYQKTEGALISTHRGGGSWVYEPVHGGTRLIWTLWSELPSSYLGKALNQALFAETGLKLMETNLARLKAYVEGKPLPE